MGRRKTFEDQFWPKVDTDPNSGCWLWNAAIFKSTGYAALQYEGRSRVAHLVAYERLVGSVPVGLELDHRCRTRCCVNPGHLEPVTHKVNVERSPIHCGARTHCPAGHAYTPKNTAHTSGQRVCVECRRNRQRAPEARAKQRAYREANREKSIAYQRERRRKHGG